MIIEIYDVYEKVHLLGLVYRDFKQANLLINEKGQIVLIDPDKITPDELWQHVTEFVGTADYIAPERQNELFASWIHHDIYSLGFTFRRIVLQQKAPWRKTQDLESILKNKIEYRLTADESKEQCEAPLAKGECELQAGHLFNWMMHPDPECRMTLTNLTQLRKIATITE